MSISLDIQRASLCVHNYSENAFSFFAERFFQQFKLKYLRLKQHADLSPYAILYYRGHIWPLTFAIPVQKQKGEKAMSNSQRPIVFRGWMLDLNPQNGGANLRNFTDEQLRKEIGEMLEKSTSSRNIISYFLQVGRTVKGLFGIGIQCNHNSFETPYGIQLLLDDDLQDEIGSDSVFRFDLSKDELHQIICEIWESKSVPDISEESNWDIL